MKRLHLPILLLSVFALVGLSQSVEAGGGVDEKEHIRELIQQWDNALVNRNSKFIDGILAEDFTYIGSDGQVQNKAEHLASITSADLKIESSSSSNFVIRIYGDTAVAVAEGRIKGSYKSKGFDNHYRYTDVWIKKTGKWAVINTQITALT